MHDVHVHGELAAHDMAAVLPLLVLVFCCYRAVYIHLGAAGQSLFAPVWPLLKIAMKHAAQWLLARGAKADGASGAAALRFAKSDEAKALLREHGATLTLHEECRDGNVAAIAQLLDGGAGFFYQPDRLHVKRAAENLGLTGSKPVKAPMVKDGGTKLGDALDLLPPAAAKTFSQGTGRMIYVAADR